MRFFSCLHERGILGMNRRNIAYVGRYNPRNLFPVADNKLFTKYLALQAGLQVPELLYTVENQHHIKKLLSDINKCEDGFCIKPAKGSGGKGILVVSRNEAGDFCRSNGQLLSEQELERHVSNILAGLFSLAGSSDLALVESLVVSDPAFTSFSHKGVPDIRVIVFLGVPVMAMMRLSCSESHGKANLHQGAVGVGLDIATGKPIQAVQFDRVIKAHPDTGIQFSELRVPEWSALLELACSCYDMCGLGYLGVDLVVDAQRGPMLLELNARPGLSIQIANRTGLLPRLNKIEQQSTLVQASIAERLEFAQREFTVF